MSKDYVIIGYHLSNEEDAVKISKLYDSFAKDSRNRDINGMKGNRILTGIFYASSVCLLYERFNIDKLRIFSLDNCTIQDIDVKYLDIPDRFEKVSDDIWSAEFNIEGSVPLPFYYNDKYLGELDGIVDYVEIALYSKLYMVIDPVTKDVTLGFNEIGIDAILVGNYDKIGKINTAYTAKFENLPRQSANRTMYNKIRKENFEKVMDCFETYSEFGVRFFDKLALIDVISVDCKCLIVPNGIEQVIIYDSSDENNVNNIDEIVIPPSVKILNVSYYLESKFRGKVNFNASLSANDDILYCIATMYSTRYHSFYEYELNGFDKMDSNKKIQYLESNFNGKIRFY